MYCMLCMLCVLCLCFVLLSILQGTLRETLMNLGIEGSENISQINMTMNYRKICNHPFLFGEPRETNGAYLGDARPQLLGKQDTPSYTTPTHNTQHPPILLYFTSSVLIHANQILIIIYYIHYQNHLNHLNHLILIQSHGQR